MGGNKKKAGRRNARHTYDDIGRYGAMPHAVYQHENFLRLTSHGRMLLLDVIMQFNGSNNGDLCITFAVSQGFGWKSRETLDVARAELLHYGLIICTKRGGLGIPSLYAVTWRRINECSGKHDAQPTNTPSGLWRQPTEKWDRARWIASRKSKKKIKTQHGSRASMTCKSTVAVSRDASQYHS